MKRFELAGNRPYDNDGALGTDVSRERHRQESHFGLEGLNIQFWAREWGVVKSLSPGSLANHFPAICRISNWALPNQKQRIQDVIRHFVILLKLKYAYPKALLDFV